MEWYHYLLILIYVLGVLANFKILLKKDWINGVWLSWLTPIIIMITIYYDYYQSRKKGQGF